MLPRDTPTSSKTSVRSSPFGEEALRYLSKLGAAMQFTVEPETVRMWLEKAQQDGLDPQELYAAAVQQRMPQWEKAPPFSAVTPTNP